MIQIEVITENIKTKKLKSHQFHELHDLLQGNLYGTRLDSVRAIIDEGRTAVLDPSPKSLKLLRNSSEFMPFIVFLGKNYEECL